MANYAIGSCYIMKQQAGAEMVGGVEIVVGPKRGETGSIVVKRTCWRTGELLPHLDEGQVDAARAGVESVAAETELPLHEFDVTIQRFVDHPVDWHPKCVRQAARSAFRSAIEGFQVQDL